MKKYQPNPKLSDLFYRSISNTSKPSISYLDLTICRNLCPMKRSSKLFPFQNFSFPEKCLAKWQCFAIFPHGNITIEFSIFSNLFFFSSLKGISLEMSHLNILKIHERKTTSNKFSLEFFSDRGENIFLDFNNALKDKVFAEIKKIPKI